MELKYKEFKLTLSAKFIFAVSSFVTAVGILYQQIN